MMFEICLKLALAHCAIILFLELFNEVSNIVIFKQCNVIAILILLFSYFQVIDKSLYVAEFQMDQRDENEN